jgi:hypothetical protein
MMENVTDNTIAMHIVRVFWLASNFHKKGVFSAQLPM